MENQESPQVEQSPQVGQNSPYDRKFRRFGYPGIALVVLGAFIMPNSSPPANPAVPRIHAIQDLQYRFKEDDRQWLAPASAMTISDYLDERLISAQADSQAFVESESYLDEMGSRRARTDAGLSVSLLGGALIIPAVYFALKKR